MMFHLLGKQKISGKWLTSMKFDYNYDDLRQLMLLVEAKQYNHLYLITHLDDTIIDTFSVTAVVYDSYAHSLVRYFYFSFYHIKEISNVKILIVQIEFTNIKTLRVLINLLKCCIIQDHTILERSWWLTVVKEKGSCDDWFF